MNKQDEIDIKDLPADLGSWRITDKGEFEGMLRVDYAKGKKYVRAVYVILGINSEGRHVVSDPIYFAEDLDHDNFFSIDEFRIVTGTDTYKDLKEQGRIK